MSDSVSRLSRRGLLAGLAGLAAISITERARADEPTSNVSRVKDIQQGERGTTIYMELANAPFPAPGAWYHDATVIAYVPSHYREPRDGSVASLVHFHGHGTTADAAMHAHELREQLYDSRQNAILLVPQGPVNSADSSCGKLDTDRGLARMLSDALTTLSTRKVRHALGDAAIRHPRIGHTCLSAHSGGYHAAACSLRRGGIEVSEVYLFDALYADVDAFRDWVLAGVGRSQRTRHKLVSYSTGGTTMALGNQLRGMLERSGVQCATESREGTLTREELTLAQAVFIHTGLAHSDVTHELNGLRDCLYASSFRRRLRTTWFDDKEEPRMLERRE